MNEWMTECSWWRSECLRLSARTGCFAASRLFFTHRAKVLQVLVRNLQDDNYVTVLYNEMTDAYCYLPWILELERFFLYDDDSFFQRWTTMTPLTKWMWGPLSDLIWASDLDPVLSCPVPSRSPSSLQVLVWLLVLILFARIQGGFLQAPTHWSRSNPFRRHKVLCARCLVSDDDVLMMFWWCSFKTFEGLCYPQFALQVSSLQDVPSRLSKFFRVSSPYRIRSNSSATRSQFCSSVCRMFHWFFQLPVYNQVLQTSAFCVAPTLTTLLP